MLKVSLFCGGRGCASIIREFIQVPDVELNLIVNAYDKHYQLQAAKKEESKNQNKEKES